MNGLSKVAYTDDNESNPFKGTTLVSSILSQFHCIGILFGQNEWMSGMILMYACIDALSWISQSVTEEETEKYQNTRYKRWVNQWMLRHKVAALDVTDEELWRLRCSIIHDMSAPSSKPSKFKKSKKPPVPIRDIHYKLGHRDHKDEQLENSLTADGGHIVYVVDILATLTKSFEVFLAEMSKDQDEAKRIAEKWKANAYKLILPSSE